MQGETAHVALGLAKGLRALGHRTILVAPLDEETRQSGLGLARRLSPVTFDLSGTTHERVVFDARLPSGVELALVSGEPPIDPSVDAAEATRRWGFFGHAVAAVARHRLGQVRAQGEEDLDAVIAIGEHASFSTMAIREGARAPHKEGPSPRLLAGLSRLYVPIAPVNELRVPRASMHALGLGDDLFSPEGVEFYGELSLTKAGILAADRVVALGEPAKHALTQPGGSQRFDGVLRARGNELVSIGSGVDQAQYNPVTDPHLTARFDPEDLTGKMRCRSSILAELELETTTELPFVVMVGPIDRAAEPALVAALSRAERGELLFAVVRPEPRREGDLDSALDRLVRTHPGRVAVHPAASEPFLHRALAAADFALLLDPASVAGTAARAAMRYGTIPIALRTPGNDEAIVDLEASLATGTGILVPSTNEADLFGAIQRAVSAHGQPAWRRLQRRVMRIEGGWERAARRLERLLMQLEA